MRFDCLLNENANCFLTYYKSFFSVFFFLEMNKYKHCQNDLYNENQTQPLLMFFVWALKSNFSEETAWSPPTGCLIYYFYFLTLFEKSESVQNIYSHNLILRVSSRIIVFRLHNGHFYTFFMLFHDLLIHLVLIPLVIENEVKTERNK